MNMLTNKVVHGELSHEDQKRFTDLGHSDRFVYKARRHKGKGEWIDDCDFCYEDKAYRLKLKEGEWYKYKDKYGENTFEWTDNKKSDFIECDVFRPATQEEIDSVKPSFKRGDVVVSNEFEYGEDDEISTHLILRLEKDNKTEVDVFFSYSVSDKSVLFNDIVLSAETNYKLTHATPDQIKQLELEEMKHGKKWNGEGYDDWLTADRLTWNELIKNKASDIEFNNDGWVKTRNNSVHFTDCIGIDDIELFRLKPQETFVDKDVTWEHGDPIVKNGLGKVNLRGWSIGASITKLGYLSCFIMDNENLSIHPIVFSTDKKEIKQKAIKARFVKVGE